MATSRFGGARRYSVSVCSWTRCFSGAGAGLLTATLLGTAGANAQVPEAQPPNSSAANALVPGADPAPEGDSRVAAKESDAAKYDAARIEALERELAEQRARLERIERTQQEETGAAQSAPTSAGGAVAEHGVADTMRQDPLERLQDGGFPKSTPLFGSKFRFGFGGYVKLDALYDFNGIGDRYAFTLSTIPTGDEPGYGPYFNMHVRETRFSFDLRYTDAGVPMNQAFVEVDFFTTSLTNFAAPRLRHAYLRWGDFLVGQTWRILTDLRTLPFIIDFAYADSLNASRAPQLRWEKRVTPWLGARVGIEMPEEGGVENPDAIAGRVSPRLPRFAGGLSLEHPWAFFSVGGSVSELRWDVPNASDAHALTWTAVANARSFLDSRKRGFLSMHASIGRGSTESTVGVFAGTEANAALRPSGSLDTTLAYSLVASYAQRWIDPISTNISLAWARITPSEQRGATQMARTRSLHANVVWSVNEPIQTGIEYMVGERKNVDGSSGTAQRVQAMAMYSF